MGPILNSDEISINHNESIKSISDWINKLDDFSNEEAKFLQNENPNLVISDVSPMPLLASYSKNIPSIIISNFSWYDVLTFLPNEIRMKLKEFYDLRFKEYFIFCQISCAILIDEIIKLGSDCPQKPIDGFLLYLDILISSFSNFNKGSCIITGSGIDLTFFLDLYMLVCSPIILSCLVIE